ncbi:ABC transporter permease [Chengkuizengella marina]|uniref:ABC transporter permease n=1 Tax=Chengkuizengella marina TaxID=2507566 RepID=A0A6N9Q219_9BACL|nr:ABC transporter permease [Chengkuizengella marina]NBI27888.1 ABC transporter permease [Chengkuizengella marina]
MDWLKIFVDLTHNTIVFSTALVFAAIGGMFSERSGVVNIALEGLMIIGAFTGAVVTFFVDQSLGGSPISPWIGFISAIVAGIIFSLPHAVASIRYQADQVVSGIALNFLAIGVAIYFTKVLFDGSAQTKTLKASFDKWEIPFLADQSTIGALFKAYPTSVIMILVVVISYVVLFKTPFGLRLRAVGEHPRAADTMGINVFRTRYIAVMISGALAAMGGATIVLTTTNNFTHSTISGQGFIALAALIFGKWHPTKTMFAALFFGMATALRSVLQQFGITDYIPVDFIFILPYVLTILVLAGLIGRADAPSALGRPYELGSR